MEDQGLEPGGLAFPLTLLAFEQASQGVDLILSGVGTSSSCTEGINRVPRAVGDVQVTTGHKQSFQGTSGKAMGTVATEPGLVPN